MLKRAVAITLLVAAAIVAGVLLTVDFSGRLVSHDDPVFERPLALRQDGRSVRLRSIECWVCPAPLNDRGFDPSRPFRIVFSSTTTLSLQAGVHRDGSFRRVGRWESSRQCFDSRCVHSIRFPDPEAKPFPRRADTLRIIVNGRAAYVRVAPKV